MKIIKSILTTLLLLFFMSIVGFIGLIIIMLLEYIHEGLPLFIILFSLAGIPIYMMVKENYDMKYEKNNSKRN